MITILIVAGAILLVAGIVLAWSVFSAPLGREDEKGFHADAPDEALWAGAKLGSAPRGSTGAHR